MNEKKKNHKNNKNEVNEIINKIKEMDELTEKNLKPEDYAVPGGYAEIIAKNVKIKTAQLRKFFNEIKRLHQQIARRKKDIELIKVNLYKLIPELVFAKGRGVISEEFYNLMEACILKEENQKKVCRLKSYEEFENFVSFLEAIVAYQKGG